MVVACGVNFHRGPWVLPSRHWGSILALFRRQSPFCWRDKGVAVDRIAYISAVGFSPSFWAFLICPVLDVRFTKRTYGFALATLAGVCLCASVLLLKHLALMTFFLTAGCTATVMFGNALMGWLPDIIEDKHYGEVGAWSNVANLGAAGVFGTLAVVLVRTLPMPLAAPMLALVLTSPTALLFFFPTPMPADARCEGNISDTVPRSLSTLPKPKLLAWPDDVFVAGEAALR